MLKVKMKIAGDRFAVAGEISFTDARVLIDQFLTQRAAVVQGRLDQLTARLAADTTTLSTDVEKHTPKE